MNLKLQLKILSFLQFCLWGSWLTTLGSYMFVTLKFDGAAIGAVYSSLGIAAVLMPTLLGIVADKWISAKWVYAICHLVGALTLYLAAQVTTPGEMFLVILLNSLEALDGLAAEIAELPHLELRGLMAIPAPESEYVRQFAVAQQMAVAFARLKTRYPTVDTLSLGMSDDMEAAIAAGSTMVRIGTAIFGARDYSK